VREEDPTFTTTRAAAAMSGRIGVTAWGPYRGARVAAIR